MSRAKRRASKPTTPAPAPTPIPGNPQPPSGPWLDRELLIGGALLVVAVLVAYFPALGGGMLWDDPAHMTKPELRSLDGLWRIWFVPGAAQQYYPFLHSFFWMQNLVFGQSTLAAHLITALLHTSVAFLAWMLLRQLEVAGAFWVSLLFALHPVNVESVAWITETKNTLSGVFYLAAFLAYLQFDRTRDSRWYHRALGLFVIALLSKTVTATLPGAILVVLWWQRGRLDIRKDVRPTAPFFAIGLIAALITSRTEWAGAVKSGPEWDISFAERIIQAGRAVTFYAGKLAWPDNLMFFYPRWTLDDTQLWQWMFPAGCLVLAGVLWLIRGRTRAPLAAYLFFCGTLLPALGFVDAYPFRFSYVADHFQYLASLGPITLVVGGTAALLVRRGPRWVRVGQMAGVGIALLFAVLVWRESRQYGKDDIAHYQVILEKNPEAWIAHMNIGITLLARGDSVGSLPHWIAARDIKPDLADVRFEIASLYYAWKRYPESVAEFQRAVELNPGYAKGRFNFGAALYALGDRGRAVAEFDAAAALDSESVEMQQRAAQVFMLLGDTARAQAASWRAQQLQFRR